MKAPIVPEEPPAVLREEALRKLLRTCDGKSYDERRDRAVLLLFIETGMRLADARQAHRQRLLGARHP